MPTPAHVSILDLIERRAYYVLAYAKGHQLRNFCRIIVSRLPDLPRDQAAPAAALLGKIGLGDESHLTQAGVRRLTEALHAYAAGEVQRSAAS